MPDFTKINSSVAGLQALAPPKQLTKFAEFSLSSDTRKSLKPAQDEQYPVTVAFKATPVKARLNENVEVTVKSSKQLTIPKDVLLSSN